MSPVVELVNVDLPEEKAKKAFRLRGGRGAIGDEADLNIGK